MAEDYENFKNHNSQFSRELHKGRGVPSYNGELTTNKRLVEGVERYSRSKRSDVICQNPVLERGYVFESTHTGRDFLYTLIEIVNDSPSFEVGNIFYFKMDTALSTRDIVLLANPTQRQPGNGVIVSSAGDCQPKSWDNLMNMLPSYRVQTFSEFFKEFMTESIDAEGPSYFVEIAALLVFEIARRLVRDFEFGFNKHKEMLDAIPVASCIAICLDDEESGIRACRDVFGHRHDRDYPEKIHKRESAARVILERNNGCTAYRELMVDLFSPEPLEDLFGLLTLETDDS